MTNGTDHSNGILKKPFVRVPDGPDDLPVEIGFPADIINDRKVSDIVKKAIDREIAPQGILRGCPETFCAKRFSGLCLNLFKFRPAPEGGDFNDLPTPEVDLDEPEPAADDAAVFKKGTYLLGMGIGGNIEIFWNPSEKEIPDAAPDQKGQEPMPMKAIEDLESLFVNPLS